MRVRSRGRQGEERAVAWEGGRGWDESKLGHRPLAGVGSGIQPRVG